MIKGMWGRRKLEKEYRQQRRAYTKVRAQVLLEQAGFVAFLVAVLALGGYLLMASPQGSGGRGAGEDRETGTQHEQGEPAAMAKAPDTPAPADDAAPREPAGGGSGDRPAPSDEPRSEPSGDTGPQTAQTPPAPEPSGGGTDALSADDAGESDAAPAEPDPEREAPEDPQTAPQAEAEDPSRQAGETRDTPAIHVQRATFTYDVVYDQPWEPVTYIEYEKTQNGRIYFFSEVNAARRTRLVHEWRHEGEVVAKQTFWVEGRNAIATSDFVIPKASHGTWRVYLRDERGKTIRIGTAQY